MSSIKKSDEHFFTEYFKRKAAQVAVFLIAFVVFASLQSCAFAMGQRSMPSDIQKCFVNFYFHEGKPCVYQEINGQIAYICEGDERYKADFVVISLEEIDCLKTQKNIIVNRCKRWR